MYSYKWKLRIQNLSFCPTVRFIQVEWYNLRWPVCDTVACTMDTMYGNLEVKSKNHYHRFVAIVN
jgi:hypothetical protein